MKKLFSILFAVVMVLSTVLSLSLSASAESLYIRKVVSVVYDDSKSMNGNKWAYANYAMQAFCGMLNSEDQLFITYMSHSQQNDNYKPERIDLSAAGIQSSVNAIRNHADVGSTPYTAVEIAYNKLKDVEDSNSNTQYWLVVITDGAFDECRSMDSDGKKTFLNENLKRYTDSVMPNGSNPQVTFLGLGNVVLPDENHSKGIYTYSAKSVEGITKAMSEMADRVSGRTRLNKDDMKKIDDNTIQVSSSIPLLNIAVFAQGSDAKITNAVYNNELDIPISRNVSLSYDNYPDLVAGAYLLGDSQNVIGSGIYNITFEQSVELDDVVVLFEPALEMRMMLAVNGKEISDNSELNNVVEGDKISASCKIYEMGTDIEVDPSLMPSGTTFELTVREDGKVVEQSFGKEMLLTEYVLKNIETEIRAAVVIEGFNPIDYAIRFTPVKYVPKIEYSIAPSFGSDARSIKLDDIANNKDFNVCFTVYADGIVITDPSEVRKLNPMVSVSPKGNDGYVTYSDDGKIVFTPNAAHDTEINDENFNVNVTCTIDDGTSATETYTVLLANYQAVSAGTGGTIKKTEFFGNQTGASFYITKDGVKLDKQAVGNNISVSLNDVHANLKTNVTVADDGTITVVPYSEDEHKLTFWNWWINWFYYFDLEDDDVTITFNHPVGSVNSSIDVVEEDLSYRILNVYLPLIIELIALTIFIIWLILVINKPRYLEGAKLYVGEIKYNKENDTHFIRNFRVVRLATFNKIKKGNGRLKFKKTADIVPAGGIKIRADHGGRIICEMLFPWYKGRLEFVDIGFIALNSPAEIADYIRRYKKVEIKEFATTETVEGDYQRSLTPANPATAKYIVVPDSGDGVSVIADKKVIKSGKIFIYINN